ncbi:hypothetical protein NLJ89_g9375 [Agrocybe chaxingu]|uniref:Uncharacterized protein n=1 Tax=Agrocybe chaxingu TaxID=84603 RepID=A0A9W8JSJ9_9AGAR|nr:hypothetical protein NLJ89_g9375 [Agrocybe chaxingu]
MRTWRVSALFTVLVGDGVAYYIGSFFLNIMPLLFTGVVPSHFPYLDVVHFWLCTFYSYGPKGLPSYPPSTIHKQLVVVIDELGRLR